MTDRIHPSAHYRELADRLRVLAADLEDYHFRGTLDLADDRGGPLFSAEAELEHWARIADFEYRQRRRRATILPDALFNEPGWEMLLDLYRHLPSRPWLRTTSLCIGSGSPPTTALRWIGVLENLGLITKSHEPRDNRVTLIGLSATGKNIMTKLLSERMDEIIRSPLMFNHISPTAEAEILQAPPSLDADSE